MSFVLAADLAEIVMFYFDKPLVLKVEDVDEVLLRSQDNDFLVVGHAH